VLENIVLRKIFGSKPVEVTGGWRKLRSEELPDDGSRTSFENLFLTKKQGRGKYLAHMLGH
jgi:hypothetical protein